MDLHRTSKDSHSIMKSNSSNSSSSSSSSNNSTGSVHQQQHQQRAAKPVIRVVHIFNPTVIKTDVANFRSLVQELTGRKSCRSDARKSSNLARKQSSVYDGHLKQLQHFISNKPRTLGIVGDESHQIIRYPSTPTMKPTSMYIPERLGIFSDLGDMVSSLQDPMMEFTDLLPSLGAVGADEDGPHAALTRFTSPYESL